MVAIVNTGPGQLELRDWPLPEPGPGQVRVRVGACAICATDLRMIEGWERTGFPAIPGHEWAGTVEALGAAVDSRLLGRRCVAENVLSDGGEVGFEHPGGYGQYLLTEAASVQPLPDDFPLWEAVLIEPLAVAVRVLRRLRVEDRSSALVLGDGPIGLLALMLLRRAGVGRVLLVGGRAERLALGRELGAAATLDYHQIAGVLAGAIRGIWSAPFPNTVEATGTLEGAGAALELAAREGHVLIVGDYGAAHADFRWNRVLLGELELIGSNASAGAWPEAVSLAIGGALPLQRLVTHRLPAARFAEGLAAMRDRRSGAIKVVLEW
jgi:L-iditol 2-dehydrogenase